MSKYTKLKRYDVECYDECAGSEITQDDSGPFYLVDDVDELIAENAALKDQLDDARACNKSLKAEVERLKAICFSLRGWTR